MSERVDVTVAVDTSQAEASIAAVKEKADEATEDWRRKRAFIISEIGRAVQMIGQVWTSFTTLIREMGVAIDPFFSQLIGMTISSVSMMLSIAAMMTSSGVGAGWGAVMGILALSVQSVVISKLIKDKAEAMGMFKELLAGARSVNIPSGLGGL